MEEKPILVERRAGYRVITLNRPQRLNAFNEAMHQALKRALVEAEEDDDCRALLLTGAGRGFCAGQDLNDRLSKPGETMVLGRRAGSLLQSAGAQAARAALPGRRRGQRRRGRRRRQYRARLRHRAGGALGELRAGLRQDRPGARFRRHLVPAAPGRPRPRPRACAHRRAADGGKSRGLGLDLEDGRRRSSSWAEAHELCTHFASAPTIGLALTKRVLDEVLGQRSRHPARSRTRDAARGQPHARLCRGRARVPGETAPRVHGTPES